MTRSPRALLVPRARPGRAADFATRAPLIANQRHPARRTRHARRSLRVVGRALKIGLGLAAAAAVALLAVHWLRTSALLGVATVEVQGTRRLADGAVHAAAAIESGANILTLDHEAIEDRVEGLPGVRSARMVRHLPNRVTLMVDEREPYALVNISGTAASDRLLWIDADGHLVGPEPRPRAPALPILSGVEHVTPRSDPLPPENLKTGLALLRAVQRAGGRVSERISEIDVAGADGPVLYLVDGAEVRVGAGSWDERLARLDGVLGELESRGERVLSVDLRFRDLVVLKPRPTSPSGPEARSGATGSRRRPALLGAAKSAGRP